MSDSLVRICLTGGPCSGKSTASKAAEEEYDILLVPEAATGMMREMSPVPGKHFVWTEDWAGKFQDAILPVQDYMEYSWRVVAEENAAKALILDRGILDGAAYMPGGLPAFIKRFDLDLEKAYSRYDMVIHLETIARSRPYLFGKGGNECRYETNPEDAVELDLKIQEAWKGHPNWHFIPGNMELEDVVAQVLDLIGEMVSWEIEKKYLLNSKVIWPCSEGIEVIQGYLLSPDMEGAELRIRRFGNNRHFMTTKSRANLKRREWERKIVKAEFESLWPATKDRRISKTRFYVPHGNYTLELDQYHGLHEGLLLLECEFKKEEEIADFHLPDWTGHAIDVTDDPQYKNLWLAEHGLPK